MLIINKERYNNESSFIILTQSVGISVGDDVVGSCVGIIEIVGKEETDGSIVLVGDVVGTTELLGAAVVGLEEGGTVTH